MKAAAFDYARAGDVAEALALLEQGGDGARLLAGGQTLGPMLNLRLVRAALLVDIRTVAELRGAERREAAIRYGAAVTHAEIEDEAVPDAAGGMLRHVAAGIAYRAVRNRGTLGGSLAHADPAADWLSALTALDATLHLRARAGARAVALAEAVTGAFSLDLRDGEVLTAVEVPSLGARARWGWYKVTRKTGEFADAIGAVVLDPDRSFARVVAGAVAGAPVRLDTVAAALADEGRDASHGALADALASALPDADAVDRHIHTVAVRRAIDRAMAA